MGVLILASCFFTNLSPAHEKPKKSCENCKNLRCLRLFKELSPDASQKKTPPASSNFLQTRRGVADLNPNHLEKPSDVSSSSE